MAGLAVSRDGAWEMVRVTLAFADAMGREKRLFMKDRRLRGAFSLGRSRDVVVRISLLFKPP